MDNLQKIRERSLTHNYKLRFWSLTALRLFLGILFVYHGFIRIFVIGNLPGSAAYFAQVGIPLPEISAFVFGVVELGGGLLLLLGILTRWSSSIIILELLIAFFYVHSKNGLLVTNNGFEFILLLMAALLVVVVNGPGHLAVSKSLKNKHLQ
jgi:putative oxidoreductase|tara:strand:+ start:6280 stop:6735 length:456 start_codon:yes stop_codon:yes gene_type:complete